MSGSPPKLLGIEDAARATGLTPKALRRRIERGTLSVGTRQRAAVDRHG